MKIRWKIHKEGTSTGGLDIDDLYGGIEIEHDGSKIVDDSIYLENWFDSLVDIAIPRETNNVIVSDLITEPDPIKANIQDDILEIAYASQKVSNVPMLEFRTALRDSGKSIIEYLNVQAPNDSLLGFKKLTDYLRIVKKKEAVS